MPQHYYLRNHVRVQYDHQATVGRGSSLQVDNEILFPGCVLRWAMRPPHTPGCGRQGPGAQAGGSQWGHVSCRWQFASDGGDIGFGVFLKTKMGERQRAAEMTEVLASQRYNAHMVPEDGSLTCTEAGVCEFWQGWLLLDLGVGGRCIAVHQVPPGRGPWLRLLGVVVAPRSSTCTGGRGPRWASSLNVCPANTDVLRFDNTYSLIHPKHISYTVEVLLPDQTSLEKIEQF